MTEWSTRRVVSSNWRSSPVGSSPSSVAVFGGVRRTAMGPVEESFEQSRGGWPQRAKGSAADESLKVAQDQRPRFLIVLGEGCGVVHELLVGHAPLANPPL